MRKWCDVKCEIMYNIDIDVKCAIVLSLYLQQFYSNISQVPDFGIDRMLFYHMYTISPDEQHFSTPLTDATKCGYRNNAYAPSYHINFVKLEICSKFQYHFTNSFVVAFSLHQCSCL